MMKTWTRVVAVIMVKKYMDSRIVESTDSDNKFYLEWKKGKGSKMTPQFVTYH